MRNVWLVSVTLCCAMTALAQNNQDAFTASGNAFVRVCSVVDKQTGTNDDSNNLALCMGYVQGFADGVTLGVKYSNALSSKDAKPVFCVPDDVTTSQLIRVALKYIRDNPADAHHSTASLLMAAIGTNFPCKP